MSHSMNHAEKSEDGKKGRKKWIIIAAVTVILFLAAIGGNQDENGTASTASDPSQTTEQQNDQSEEDATDSDENEADSDEEATTEPSFSADDAMKALTVACSNGVYAWDVYMDDGNTIDPDKMHPYDQNQRGNYLYGHNYDDSYVVDENTWHIDGLNLENYDNGSVQNYEFEASGDVSFDGENYLVSNITMEYTKYAQNADGSINIWGGTETGTYCSDRFSDEPFEVSPSLIEDDN